MTVKLTAAALADRKMWDKHCIYSAPIVYLVLHLSWSAPMGVDRSIEKECGRRRQLSAQTIKLRIKAERRHP
jgi:hypothetical protein